MPKRVLLKTTMGDITIELYDDMPITAGNFLNLVLGRFENPVAGSFPDARSSVAAPLTAEIFSKLVTKPFYDGLTFHRIIPAFMVQGGCPNGNGTGGPGYAIKDEFTSHNHNGAWTVAMANAGPNTGGSQFFLNLVDNAFLDGKHPVFGKVVAGRECVEEMSMVEVDAQDKPTKEIRILKATVL